MRRWGIWVDGANWPVTDTLRLVLEIPLKLFEAGAPRTNVRFELTTLLVGTPSSLAAPGESRIPRDCESFTRAVRDFTARNGRPPLGAPSPA